MKQPKYLIKQKKKKRRRKGKGPHTNTTCASLRTEVHVSQQPKVQENSHSFSVIYIYIYIYKEKINKQRAAKAAGTKKGWSPLPSSGLPLPINTLHQAPRLPHTGKAPSNSSTHSAPISVSPLCASSSHPSVQPAATTAVQFFTQIVGDRRLPVAATSD
jgi:hypothetical protein